jgi:hypothetical protein
MTMAEETQPNTPVKVWRLTLECGHLRLSGPWTDTVPDDEHMIGDITFCEVCPRIPDPVEQYPALALRQVVNVEPVPAGRYREPEEKDARGRMEQSCA